MRAPKARISARWAGWRAGIVAVTALVALGALMVGASGASGGSDALKAKRGGGLIDVGSNLYGGRVPYVRPDGKVVNLKVKRKALNKALRKKLLRRAGIKLMNHPATIGEERVWLALDDTLGATTGSASRSGRGGTTSRSGLRARWSVSSPVEPRRVSTSSPATAGMAFARRSRTPR